MMPTKIRPKNDAFTLIREHLTHDAGENANIAAVLTAIHLLGQKCSSREAQKLAGVNRTQMSLILRSLKTGGLVHVEDGIPTPDNKGRPPYSLSLTTPLHTIITSRLNQQEERVKQARARTEKLLGSKPPT